MKSLKQKTLAAALVASGAIAFAGSAGAVAVSSEGLGEALIYPYYTARGNNISLLSVVNTTDQGKVVKVRFREAKDSRDVLDFNLYLSPWDVWTGGVSPNVAGTGSRLITNDNSCTDPGKTAWTNLGGGSYAVDFFNFEYQARDASDLHGSNAVAGPQSLDRTLEGYVEIIEMATIPTSASMYPELKHDSKGVPTCGQSATDVKKLPLSNVVDPTVRGNRAPSGGLFGAVTYVATGNQGMATAVNATALNGFGRDGTIFTPAGQNPNFADHSSCVAAVSSSSEVVVANMSNVAGTTCGAAASTSAGRIARANAVSATLMSAKVSGEYAYTNDLSLGTDWVVTFPAKHFYVDRTDILGATTSTAAIPPFTSLWNPKNGNALENVRLSTWDREEGQSLTGCNDPANAGRPECLGFSPPPVGQTPGIPALPVEANVISFAPASKKDGASVVMASNNALFLNAYQAANKEGGWMEMTFIGTNALAGIQGTTIAGLSLLDGSTTRASGTTVTFVGLPVIGFSVANARVTVATPGQPLNNYQSSVNLTYTRSFSPARGN